MNVACFEEILGKGVRAKVRGQRCWALLIVSNSNKDLKSKILILTEPSIRNE
jgi:hypothetical protein